MLGLGDERELRRFRLTRGRGGHRYHRSVLPAYRKHLPVQQYVHPDLFARYPPMRRDGFPRYVQSGPLVRSSYHAAEQVFPLDPAE